MATNAAEDVYDQLLVLRAQEGDKEALAELVNRWQPRLLRHALRLTENTDGVNPKLRQRTRGLIRRLAVGWFGKILVNNCHQDEQECGEPDPINHFDLFVLLPRPDASDSINPQCVKCERKKQEQSILRVIPETVEVKAGNDESHCDHSRHEIVHSVSLIVSLIVWSDLCLHQLLFPNKPEKQHAYRDQGKGTSDVKQFHVWKNDHVQKEEDVLYREEPKASTAPKQQPKL